MTRKAIYDCLVIGVGGIGSAALYHLARRGVKALGLDRFPPGHDRGSSHGETRVFRQAYMEHPDYVPLAQRSYALWRELAAKRAEALYTETGFLQVGPAEGAVVRGVLKSAREHNLAVEELSARDVERRFPAFGVPESMKGVFESQAGFLAVEACVRAHAEEAIGLGATVHSDEPALSWKAEGAGVVVTTERGAYCARSLIITAGAWAPLLLKELGVPFEVRRKPLFWFATREPSYSASNGCPCFFFETQKGLFYGVPGIDDFGVKAAEHTGGDPVENPLGVDRGLHPEDQSRVEEFLGAHLPGVSHTRTQHTVCLYTMTPDAHFVVDRHPANENVAFAAGLSGHGFKFAPALGEALTDLVLEGKTQAPIGFLSSRRGF